MRENTKITSDHLQLYILTALSDDGNLDRNAICNQIQSSIILRLFLNFEGDSMKSFDLTLFLNVSLGAKEHLTDIVSCFMITREAQVYGVSR